MYLMLVTSYCISASARSVFFSISLSMDFAFATLFDRNVCTDAEEVFKFIFFAVALIMFCNCSAVFLIPRYSAAFSVPDFAFSKAAETAVVDAFVFFSVFGD